MDTIEIIYNKTGLRCIEVNTILIFCDKMRIHGIRLFLYRRNTLYVVLDIRKYNFSLTYKNKV